MEPLLNIEDNSMKKEWQKAMRETFGWHLDVASVCDQQHIANGNEITPFASYNAFFSYLVPEYFFFLIVLNSFILKKKNTKKIEHKEAYLLKTVGIK